MLSREKESKGISPLQDPVTAPLVRPVNSRRFALLLLLSLSLPLLLPLLALALDALFPPPLAALNDLSVMALDRGGAPLRVIPNRTYLWRLPAKPAEVAPLYRDLLLVTEDQRFYRHWGVDPLAVLRAAGQNLRMGRVVSGASTLSMQVARRLEPHPRGWGGKLQEALRALQLEWHFDKETLLGMYLTLAPFGGPVEGVRAAALTLFGKEPAALTVAEAALLVALPQAPSRLRPERDPIAAAAARAKVLARGQAAGVLSATQVAEALDEPVPVQRLPLPAAAPHFTDSLRQRAAQVTLWHTSLDGPLQRALEALAREEARMLHPKAGLALLVVENRGRRIRAAVGAPNPFDVERNGAIDMTRAPRSPGSALKPFVYGLGFEDGLIHPETVVADVSTRFGDYAPANFDKGFHGDMTIREALQRSLNVPAVLVLDRVGPLRFVEVLRHAGTRLVFPKGMSRPGLPVVLGGMSVSLWDMTTLYVALAQGGWVAPLRMLETEPEGGTKTAAVRLLSDTAAWQVRRILEGTPPPPGRVQTPEIIQGRRIALKTGTSYGFRDAWSFGVSERYTVGVWVGRPDGTPSPDQYGRNTAAPLLFRIFDLLPDDGPLAAPMPAALPSDTAPALLRRLEADSTTIAEPPALSAAERAAALRPVVLPDSERLRLVFPPAGAVLEYHPDAPLQLAASGGRRPLTWLIDGHPLPVSPLRRDISWQPQGPGFIRITVLDAEGRSAAINAEVR